MTRSYLSEGQNIYSRERQEAIASHYISHVQWLRVNGRLSTPAWERGLEYALRRVCDETAKEDLASK